MRWGEREKKRNKREEKEKIILEEWKGLEWEKRERGAPVRHGARRDTVNRWEAINFGLECPIAPHFVQCKFTSDVDHLTGLPFVSFSLKTTRISAVAFPVLPRCPLRINQAFLFSYSRLRSSSIEFVRNGWRKKKFIFLKKFMWLV